METWNQYEVIPLAVRLEHAYISENGLYPHEIIVLSHASKYSEQDTSFSSFWRYNYGIDDVKTILKSLFARGFLRYASVEETLKHETVVQIKEYLKNKELKITGNKSTLIERILQNIPQDEIAQHFTKRYYEPTELGNSELERHQVLVWVDHNCQSSIDIWTVNRLMYENPDAPIVDLIIKEFDDRLNKALEDRSYAVYLYTVSGAIRSKMEIGQFAEALKDLAYQIYFEVNAVVFSQAKWFKNDNLTHIFPYSTATWKLSPSVKTVLANLKLSLKLSDDELVERLIDLTDNFALSFEIFNKQECAQIAVYDMGNETGKISEIYTAVEERIKANYPDVGRAVHQSILNEPKTMSEKERAMIEKKEKILLDSFNALKDDVKTNHEQLCIIMKQLQKSQPETVLEMWKYLIEKNWYHVVRDRDEYDSIAGYLTSDVMHALTNDEGFLIFEDYFVTDSKILKAVYQYSPELEPWSTSVIATQLKRKNFEAANMMMEYMYANKKNNFIKDGEYCNSCFSSIYKDWIDDYLTTSKNYYGDGSYGANSTVDAETFEFLSYWAERINDPQERARTNVFLMELI